MWISNIASSLIANYFMNNAEHLLRIQHFYKGAHVLANALLTQIIGNVFWFVAGCGILISSLIGERKLFDVASGVFFFLSGGFDLVLSVGLFSFRAKMLYVARHLPALNPQKVNSLLFAEQESYLWFVNICYPGVIGSLGLAFLCIAIYYVRFTRGIFEKAKFAPSTSLRSKVHSGVTRIRLGSASYIILAISNLLQALTFSGVLPSVIPSWFYNLTFFLWIIGMILIGSGSRKINQALSEQDREGEEE